MRNKLDILQNVLWFENKLSFDIDYFDLLRPHREVSHNGRYNSGLFHSEKCGRDIQYESALELQFIQKLEMNPRAIFYWEQPVKIPYWRGKRKVTYTPDFGIYLNNGYVILTEIKELADMLDYRVQQKTEALMEFCSKRGFGLLLTDGRHTPKDLLKGNVNRKLEREVLSALEHGTLRQPQCRGIIERCQATPRELHKAVIRLGLRFRPFPMMLRSGNDCRIFHSVFFEKKRYDEIKVNNFLTYHNSL